MDREKRIKTIKLSINKFRFDDEKAFKELLTYIQRKVGSIPLTKAWKRQILKVSKAKNIFAGLRGTYKDSKCASF